MVTVNDVISWIEEKAPLDFQEDYDNSGLLTGDRNTEVTGVLVCLDCIEDVIKEAIDKGCNLIVAHHPVIFSGLKKITGRNFVERTIIQAIKNDIAIYAVHTNLDNAADGVNAEIAKRLGLINASVLSPKNGMLQKLITYCPSENTEQLRDAFFNAGAGRIGNYDQCSFTVKGEGTFRPLPGSDPYSGKINQQKKGSEDRIEIIFRSDLKQRILQTLKENHPYEEVAYDVLNLDVLNREVGSGLIGQLPDSENEMDFLLKLKNIMKTGCIKYTNLLNKKITRVAVCGGSGSFLLRNAISSGADVFITSDFKYHQFFEADNKIIIADIGHYESEQYTIELISNIIIEKFSTFAVLKTGVITNPVHYM